MSGLSSRDETVGNAQVQHVRRKSIAVLALGQILGGLGGGATLTLGSLLIVNISGLDALAGMAATMNTLGAAVMAIPLALMAQKYGRRISLSMAALLAASGVLVIVASAIIRYWPLLMLGMLILGTGAAMNLQSRFAATDLSSATTRGRDLSVVVWSTTIGAVIGPNLFEPGEVLAAQIQLPPFTGGFVLAMGAQLVGALVYWFGLRPDPLILAQQMNAAQSLQAQAPRRGWQLLRSSSEARRAVLTVSLTHMYMVSMMSMTPIHMQHHGATLTLIGITISIHVAGMYALSPVFGWLTDRVGARKVILLGQILLILASALVWSNPSAHLMTAVALGCLGLGWSASTVAGSALVSGAVDVFERPQLQGASDFSMSLAGVVGGLSGGPILMAIGFPGLALVLMFLAVIIIMMNASRSGTSN